MAGAVLSPIMSSPFVLSMELSVNPPAEHPSSCGTSVSQSNDGKSETLTASVARASRCGRYVPLPYLHQVIGSVSGNVGLMTARCTEATTLLCLDFDRFAAVTNDLANAERIAKKVGRTSMDVD